MVEDGEERILSAWSVKVLDVIHDEHVHLLVECYEVCELVLDCNSIHELCLEPARRDIKDNEIRIFLLDCDTYRLCKVCLSETWTSEEEQWVERSLARSGRDALSGCESHPVALTYHEVFKTVYRIQLRIYLNALHSREDERTRVSSPCVCLY